MRYIIVASKKLVVDDRGTALMLTRADAAVVTARLEEGGEVVEVHEMEEREAELRLALART